MKYLTIIRHAKSSWANPGQDDIDRPLNDRGKNAIPIVGAYLKDQQVRPDLAITSPAKRAMKTAKGVCEFVGYKPEKLKIFPEIYFGDTDSVLLIIREINDEYTDVFLFGHEPKLSNLITRLIGEKIEKFSTCSAYRMSFDVPKWSDVRPGSGHCEFYVNPKLLGEK
jgi:phosphohistidine phosphatase